jgi:hypothetical protein
MRRAADIARNDPAAGVGVLKFYTNLLIKNGNGDHLINKIIFNQSYYEQHNLDIVAVVFVITTSLAVGVIFFLVKCLKFCWRTIICKIKTDQRDFSKQNVSTDSGYKKIL